MKISEKTVLQIVNELEKFIQNKTDANILTLISLFSRGHLLIEDLPGVGKTTLAIAVSKSLGLTFGRIQCTSDLLPSDITGISVFSKKENDFIFKKGPIFNNIVLIDEINRTTQKTQSALLEAMEEEQVTVDNATFKLPEPFFVIATQNPSEHFGTFPLPDSQMDRFIMNISIGYPDKERETEILKRGIIRKEIEKIKPVISKEKISEIFSNIDTTYVSEKILKYIVDIAHATRNNNYLISGVSPRGSLALLNCCKTFAYFQSRDYVTPFDVKTIAPFVLSHRIIFKREYSTVKKRDFIANVIENIPLPI